MRALGADILARWDTEHATREVYTAGEFSEEYSGESAYDRPLVTAFNRYPPHTSQRRRRFATPYGTLTQTWTLTEQAGADFESEHWWKDWSEYQSIRFLLEAREYAFDAAEFHRWVERVGDDGVMMAHITQSPLKALHWLAGPENASLWVADHPAEMQALARIHEEKALRLLESMVDNPDAQVFMSLDNLDSAFYPPRFYQDFCQQFFHARGRNHPPPEQDFRGPRLRPQPRAHAPGGRVSRGLPGRAHAAAHGQRAASGGPPHDGV